MTVAVIALAALLAAANGANDVPKAVATLSGAGVTRYRTAIAWGTLATFAGSLASITVAQRLTELFSNGIVDAEPTLVFTVAVLAGVAAWLASATLLRLPVSTTHAIVGALVGAGLVETPHDVQWRSSTTNVAAPLLLSVGVAFALSTLLNAVGRRRLDRLRGRNMLRGLHWLSSGAAGFARGLNDTPKIAAIAAFALSSAGWSATEVVLLIGVAMAAGSLLAGGRLARRLATDIVRMDDSEGMRANVALSVLVGIGASRGLPMSTTQVATGAIAGASGGRLDRVNRGTLNGFAIAWLATLPAAALAAALVHIALG